MKELDDSTEEEDSVFISEELDPFDSADAPLRVTLDEDFSLSAELLLETDDELTGSSPFGSAELPLSPPHAASNPAAPNATKNFFIKNVIIILD